MNRAKLLRQVIAQLRDAANNPSLEIGEAWNLLDKAADTLEMIMKEPTHEERTCQHCGAVLNDTTDDYYNIDHSQIQCHKCGKWQPVEGPR